MFDKNFYENKKQKLNQKSQSNLQQFITSAFNMVSEASDITERINEIDAVIAENTKKEEVKATSATAEVVKPKVDKKVK